MFVSIDNISKHPILISYRFFPQIFSIAQQLDLSCKPLHPLPCFPREKKSRTDALVYRYPFFPGDKVIGVCDNLLFRCHGHAVAGRQPQERTFVCGKTGPGMALNDTGDLFAKAHRTYKVSTALCVADIVGPAPADIVEHCTLFDEMKIDFRVVGCIPAGTIPYCPAVDNDFCAAPGIAQQVLTDFFLFFRHGQATS
jgi:hypothetical protein